MKAVTAAVASAMATAALIGGIGRAIGNDATLYACVHNKAQTIKMTTSSKACPSGYTRISWNTAGIKGDPGAQGPKGDRGPAGTPGAAGVPGGLSCADELRILTALPSFQIRNGCIPAYSDGLGPRFLLFDGTYLWSANETDDSVTKVDVGSGAIIATVHLQAGSDPSFLAYDGTNIWVGNRAGSVTKVVAASATIAATYPLPPNHHVHGILSDGSSIWALSDTAGTVDKIDPSSGGVLATYSVGSIPWGLAFDGKYLWIANAGLNSLAKVDRATGATITTVGLPAGSGPRSIVYDGAFLYVANFYGASISKVDPTTGAVVATIQLPSGSSPEQLVVDRTPTTPTGEVRLWTSLLYQDSVAVVSTSPGSPATVYHLPSLAGATGIAFDGSNVWVAGSFSNQITKFQAR